MEILELKTVIDGYAQRAEAGLAEAKKAADAAMNEAKAAKAAAEAADLAIQRKGIFGGGSDTGAGDIVLERKALAEIARNGVGGEAMAEVKAMSVGSDPDGGYTVFPAIAATMRSKLFDQSAIARLAGYQEIKAGGSFERIQDEDESDAAWVGETDTRTEKDTPQIGKVSIPLREIYSLHKITQRLLDDSSVDIGMWLEGKMSDKIARTEGAAFLNGTGNTRPRGILTYDTSALKDGARAASTLQHVVTGNASAFPALNTGTGVSPFDPLIDLIAALRAPYRRGAVFVMNSLTAATIQKFKDGEGRNFWQPALVAGQPATLLGFAVELDENMPDIGAGNFPVLFGNLSAGYTRIDRPGIKTLRDPYTNKGFVNFYGYRRAGGDVEDFEAIKLLKVAAS